ncbi:tetratricopeptide repeat protein [Pseudomonas chlororaphis]|uniref:tetratricopeptide repeat protein n=2 Tax=Pseudomonas chlororaphis TaxID=587753 RepID=UPI0023672188|nr:sel1 repeat family protein [Pseudomonas chlororaphis]WDG53418.1 sel1 repeat family protein [Pseudomonas chlororaphis]WDH85560.1 sel1 repeat family protein [Pseudomonas chlororaphis]
MMKIRKIGEAWIYFLLLTACISANAAISIEEKKAKDTGIELYNQFKAISAVPYLRIAAEGGDDDAQYYLGEAIRKNKRYIDEEAQQAYQAAARQGNVYAMIRLTQVDSDLCTAMSNCPKSEKTPKEWLELAKSTASMGASQKNGESMYLMYELSGDKAWLKKSAENNFPLAQYLLATDYKEGSGFFLSPSGRANEVERWMKASAEGGYPRGMTHFAAVLYDKKDLEGFRKWTEKAAETGYAEGIFGYGYYLSGKYPEYGFPVDLVKSYALLSLLLELDGGGTAKDDAEYVLPKIKEKMTPLQIVEAEKISSAWKASHPPLSFFPFKLSR